MGTVSPGDLIAWTKTDCSTIIDLTDPTDGTNAATSFRIAESGTYKLCYQRSDESAAVEQPGISLVVPEGIVPLIISRISCHTLLLPP